MTNDIRDGLLIRIMERADLEQARQLHNDDTTLFMLHDIRHVSEAEQEQWYESVSRSRTSRRYCAIDVASNRLVGLFRLDQLDLQNRSALVGLDIVKEFRGRGHAKTIYAYFFSYLFKELGVNRLSLLVLETNQVALSLYRSLGFIEEGRQRQAIFRSGKFIDLLAFSLLRDEYYASIGRQ
jgi:RimJ/RimL family protein N-acetyltransferase